MKLHNCLGADLHLFQNIYLEMQSHYTKLNKPYRKFHQIVLTLLIKINLKDKGYLIFHTVMVVGFDVPVEKVRVYEQN